MNKILISGASGYLGRKLLEWFSGNYMITTIGRRKLPGDHMEIDFREKFQVAKNFDLIIHAAGLAHGMDHKNISDPDYFKVNVTGTRHFLEALQNSIPQAFVYISSVAVYGKEVGEDLDEDTPLKAPDAYGKSKIDAEKLITEWCRKHHVRCTILRLPLIVAGEDPPGNLGQLKRAIQKGWYFNIGKGEAKRSMILAEDVAKFIHMVHREGGVFNLTDGQGASFREIGTVLSQQLGTKAVRSIPKWMAFPLAICGDLLNSLSIKFPLTSPVYRKMTKSLTFTSNRMNHMDWKPRNVLEHLKI